MSFFNMRNQFTVWKKYADKIEWKKYSVVIELAGVTLTVHPDSVREYSDRLIIKQCNNSDVLYINDKGVTFSHFINAMRKYIAENTKDNARK